MKAYLLDLSSEQLLLHIMNDSDQIVPAEQQDNDKHNRASDDPEAI
jgi:hypothetical protein